MTSSADLPQDADAAFGPFFMLSLDMFCIASSDGYFKRVNPAFTHALGWTTAELLAQPFLEFVHPDDRAATQREVERQVAMGERVLRFENRYRHKDGSWRVLSWRSVPQPGGLMYGTARDVTDDYALRADLNKAKEAAEAANRAKSTFLATMSHEIRTPLYGVLGTIDLLSMTPLDPEQRANLEVVSKSGKALQRIIDDILEFSKIEAGEIAIQSEVVSVAALVAAVRNTYSGTAGSKGLTLSHHVDPAISPAVCVDGMRLQQVLGNFVGNAIKFTPSGGSVTLRAELAGRADGTDTVRFSVRDTGIGISAEDQQRLFQPFVQAERDTSRRFGGTGLGLAISQRIAGLLGGRIELHSERNVGTTLAVVVPLPVADPARLPAEARPRAEAAKQASRAPQTIAEGEAAGTLVLIVDDHPLSQKVLRTQLARLGYAAEVVASGADALKRWESGRFGLILAECNMPVMSGYDLARRVRERERQTDGKHVPIIALTANSARDERQACLDAGMDDCLHKPIEFAALAGKLKQWRPLKER